MEKKKIGVTPFPDNQAVYGPNSSLPPIGHEDFKNLLPKSKSEVLETLLIKIYHHYDSLAPDNLSKFEIDMLHDINHLLKIESKL